jgi:hypothetical protein
VGRIAAGWHLAKLSLRVVWSDGSLSALVVLGGIASGAVALAFLVPAAVAYGIEEKVLAAVLTAIGSTSRRSSPRTSPSRSRPQRRTSSTGATGPCGVGWRPRPV